MLLDVVSAGNLVRALSRSAGTMEDTVNDNIIDVRNSFSDIATYLSCGTYPADATEATKSSLHKRSKFFCTRLYLNLDPYRYSSPV